RHGGRLLVRDDGDRPGGHPATAGGAPARGEPAGGGESLGRLPDRLLPDLRLQGRRGAAAQEAREVNGGGGRIRTCEPLRASGFQDRRLQPLGHSSGGVITARYPVALGSVEAQRKQSVSGEPVSDDARAYAGDARLATFTRHR